MQRPGQSFAPDAHSRARRLVRLDRAMVASILPLAGKIERRLGPRNREVEEAFAVYEQDDGLGRAANRFLHERGELCTYEERAWLLAQQRARFSAWRVLAASPLGGAASVREVFSGEQGTPRALGPSLRGLVRGDAILARLVEHEGLVVATAVHGTPLAGKDVELYLELLRRSLGVARPPSGRDVRARAMAPLLVDAWGLIAELVAERVADAVSYRR